MDYDSKKTLKQDKQSLQTTGRGFTLVEVLVSLAVLSVIMTILLSITSETQRTWSQTSAKLQQFQSAQNAFESINRKLRQATLNTYWDYAYDDPNDPNRPTRYERRSELRFISGPVDTLGIATNRYGHAVFFQAPFGYTSFTAASDYSKLNKLLNTWGYYVELTDGTAELPGFLQSGASPRWRLRLFELAEPSDELTLFNSTSGDPDNTSTNWFTTPLGNSDYSHMLAENIVALIIRPKESSKNTGTLNTIAEDETKNIAPNYIYDSSGVLSGSVENNQINQLPPIISVTLVAIDEESALRLGRAGLQDLAAEVNRLYGSNAAAKNYHTNMVIADNTASLEKYMADNNINYRVYENNINISGSKWSINQ